MFRKDVVGWCRKELAILQQIDMDIVSALEKEASQNPGNNGVTFTVNQRISWLKDLASPFVPDAPGASSLIAWGLNPRAVSNLSESRCKELFGENLQEDDGFSRYEILCFRLKYGLHAEDFPKFSCGNGANRNPGTYYYAYQSKIDMMMREPDKYVTPHLDKRWHLPAYMPDLNMRQEKVDES
jgi:hypothetical protein